MSTSTTDWRWKTLAEFLGSRGRKPNRCFSCFIYFLFITTPYTRLFCPFIETATGRRFAVGKNARMRWRKMSWCFNKRDYITPVGYFSASSLSEINAHYFSWNIFISCYLSNPSLSAGVGTLLWLVRRQTSARSMWTLRNPSLQWSSRQHRQCQWILELFVWIVDLSIQPAFVCQREV